MLLIIHVWVMCAAVLLSDRKKEEKIKSISNLHIQVMQ